ncbi:hypothetical protein INR49_016082 [Caranx melampygus]|nr:hypothetical protein INR49_016082 [Caranx melampygus]
MWLHSKELSQRGGGGGGGGGGSSSVKGSRVIKEDGFLMPETLLFVYEHQILGLSSRVYTGSLSFDCQTTATQTVAMVAEREREQGKGSRRRKKNGSAKLNGLAFCLRVSEWAAYNYSTSLEVRQSRRLIVKVPLQEDQGGTEEGSSEQSRAKC